MVHGLAPDCLTNLIQVSKPARQLRNSTKLLQKPYVKPRIMETGFLQEQQLMFGTFFHKN